MGESAPLRITIVSEAQDDFDVASALADRVLVEGSTDQWLHAGLLEFVRTFVGSDDTASFVIWSRAEDLFASARHMGRRLVADGHFAGRPGKADAAAARKILRALQMLPRPPDVVVLIRDLDDQPERKDGLEQARESGRWLFKSILIGAANPKREAWILAGYEPKNPVERASLEMEHRTLGFDPRAEAHRLNDKAGHAPRNIKRVVAAPTGEDRQRERECFLDTSLETLRARGVTVGLTPYLEEVASRLLPVIEGAQ